MTTPPSLFLFMIVCIVGSAVFTFGLSMLFRRASAEYAFIASGLALFPIIGFGPNLVTNESLFGDLAFDWSLILLSLPLVLCIQVRALGITPGRATAGLVADIGIAFLWIAALSVFEMFASGDGGPGYEQYALISLVTFFAAQTSLPTLIARAFPKRPHLPPVVARPGEYPRP